MTEDLPQVIAMPSEDPASADCHAPQKALEVTPREFGRIRNLFMVSTLKYIEVSKTRVIGVLFRRWIRVRYLLQKS